MSIAASTLFFKTPWFSPAASDRNKKAQREEITSLLLQLFPTCLAKPARISVPFHPPPPLGAAATVSPHTRPLPMKNWVKKEKLLISTNDRHTSSTPLWEGGAAAPQASQATHPHPVPRRQGGGKSRWRQQHKAGPEGSGMVIYPNPARGGEGSGGTQQHLAVPGRRCGNAAVPPALRSQAASHSAGEEKGQ